MRFARVISLGLACDTTFHIRRVIGQERSLPLDWLITPFDALVELIETRFAGFLDPAYLRAGGKGVYCARSGIRFLHEWHDRTDLSIEYPGIRDKYDRRIARFLEAMEAGGPVLFIRSCSAMNDQLLDPARARRLHQALSDAFPAVEAHLAGLNPESAGIPAWSEGRVSIVPLRDPPRPDWRGDREAWDGFFAGIAG